MSARVEVGARLAMIARLAVALVVTAALVTNALTSLRDGVIAQNLSFFTNQSNALYVVAVVLVAAYGSQRPAWLDAFRGAVTFYLLMTGVIYATLVAPLDELGRWDIGWTGIVLHRLSPVAAVLGWLLTPRRHSARWSRALWWQLYPIAFLAFTWIRGGQTGWYPYGFLDPTLGGWQPVLLTTFVVLVVFLASGALVHSVEGLLRRSPTARRH